MIGKIMVGLVRGYMTWQMCRDAARMRKAELAAKEHEQFAREYNDWQREKIRIKSNAN